MIATVQQITNLGVFLINTSRYTRVATETIIILKSHTNIVLMDDLLHKLTYETVRNSSPNLVEF